MNKYNNWPLIIYYIYNYYYSVLEPCVRAKWMQSKCKTIGKNDFDFSTRGKFRKAAKNKGVHKRHINKNDAKCKNPKRKLSVHFRKNWSWLTPLWTETTTKERKKRRYGKKINDQNITETNKAKYRQTAPTDYRGCCCWLLVLSEFECGSSPHFWWTIRI